MNIGGNRGSPLDCINFVVPMNHCSYKYYPEIQ